METEPAPRSICPTCGRFPKQTPLATPDGPHELVAVYVCQTQHFWQVRWVRENTTTPAQKDTTE